MLKLLIITQKVDRNDPILGFFHRWLEELAKNTEKLTVICLEKGEYRLPENVKILSLGKPAQGWPASGGGRLFAKTGVIFNFYKYIWRERKNYDAVFVHMNPEYVILGWAEWKILGKKIALWYTHKSVDLKLRLAEKLVDKIFTASRESFRLPSKKIEIVGHGIDIDKFKIQNEKLKTTTQNPKLTIITAGRIAPVKNLEILLEAVEILKNKNIDFEIKIAGGPMTVSDKKYFEKLGSAVDQKNLRNNVSFPGPIPYPRIQDFYAESDIFVNLSETGSVDKAVLEAMASGLSVITSNEAFQNILPSRYFLAEKTPEKLAEKIQELAGERRPNEELREIVAKNHSLGNLIPNLIKKLKN